MFDKDSGALVASRTADAAFAFHHVNAYEEGSDLLIDVITYDDAGIIDQLYLSRLRAGETVNATGRLTRCIVPLDDAEPVEMVPLADEMIELPRIDYDRCAGRPYRFVWGAGRTPGRRLPRQHRAHRCREPRGAHVARRRLLSRASRYSSPSRAPVEEGEGVLLSVVLDARRGSSFLLVLDAHSLAEIARAECPHHIPFSFHGNFFPARR